MKDSKKLLAVSLKALTTRRKIKTGNVIAKLFTLYADAKSK